jgi:hypothetical protein
VSHSGVWKDVLVAKKSITKQVKTILTYKLIKYNQKKYNIYLFSSPFTTVKIAVTAAGALTIILFVVRY